MKRHKCVDPIFNLSVIDVFCNCHFVSRTSNNHLASSLKIAVLVLVSGLCLVFLALELYTQKVLVDYKSGQIKKVGALGSLVLQSNVEPLYFFDSILIEDSGAHVSADWHIALVYRGLFSTHSPNIQPSGEVLRSLRRLDDIFRILEDEDARVIKKTYLSLLLTNELAAVQYANVISKRNFEDYDVGK